MWFGPIHGAGVWRSGLSLVLVLAAGTVQGAATVEEIVRRLVEQSTAMANQLEQRTLSYSKQSVVEQLDKDGQIHERQEWFCACNWHAGKIEMRVVSYRERHGDRESAWPDPKAAGPGRASGAAKPSSREERPFRVTPALAGKYHYTLLGEEAVKGRPCHVLRFVPKADLEEHGVVDRFMNQMAGRLWIDQQDYAVARAEVSLQAPVLVWGGVLGAVRSFRYTLERGRVGEGLWLNRWSKSQFELRKLLVSREFRTESKWQDVRLE